MFKLFCSTGKEISLCRIHFVNFHLTEIKIHHDHQEHHRQCQKSIQIIRNCPHKQLESCNSGIFRNIGIYSCRPTGDRRNNTYRCCGGIDQISQFCTGNLVPVCNRTHNGSNRQTVKIVIHKNQDSKSHRSQRSLLFRFNLLSRPVTVSGGTS